jgi:hypothetical protein
METECLVPRELCASSCQWDALWVSHVTLHFGAKDDHRELLTQCDRYWSPGLVIIIPPDRLETIAFKEFATGLLLLSSKFGKARRITSATPISHDIMQLLYQSFYCVEFMNAMGQMQVMDDGKASVVPARMVY